MTLETLLAEIAEAGFHVDLIHQNHNGDWQGSLREVNDPSATYPVTGATLFVALHSAFLKAKFHEGRRVQSIAINYENLNLDLTCDLQSVLSSILLRPTINRRI